ncbi:hypothetical protein GCM10022244_02940 [Streptomyces gulbargensis]|uniref:Uncharacterized protein n=1 Tax=Streptomyces gulbargensis TaxID=364901 RepID=A0ABP7L7B6_9ACTN
MRPPERARRLGGSGSWDGCAERRPRGRAPARRFGNVRLGLRPGRLRSDAARTGARRDFPDTTSLIVAPAGQLTRERLRPAGDAEVGTCMAPAPYAPVVRGGYTVTHAEQAPFPRP